MPIVPAASPKQAAQEYRNPWPRRLKRTLVAFLILLLGLLCAVAITIFFASKNLQADAEQIEQKMLVADSEPTTIVSADGVELFRLVDEYRKPFTLADVPDHVVNAFLAAEDKRFYTHSGVDPVGLFRVAFLAARERRLSQGGSTITMQLAKRLVNGDDRSMDRKFRDIALALQLEKLKTKEQLLELYLKQVYFGEGAYGLASAAEIYFGKEIKDLTIGEAAILSRCVRRPSDENPISNYKRALANRNVVLDIMLEEGMISQAEAKQGKAEKPRVMKASKVLVSSKTLAPYFVDYIFKSLREQLPDINLRKGGYRVETTIRMDIQEYAEGAVLREVQKHRRQNVQDGCFVLTNANGEIVAMVGGTNYKKDQFNTVTMGLRSPGSSFKPIVYAAALQEGKLAMGQQVSNRPISFPQSNGKVWSPKNSGRWEASSYDLGTAFAYSINRPAIWTSFETGREVVVQYAHDRFGIQSKLDPVLSIALGPMGVHPLEMAEVYSVFASRGDRIRPFGIRRVTGPDGNAIYVGTARKFPRVLDEWVADSMDQLLEQVVQRGTATAARVIPNARGKTGTTNDNRDAWFCGYSDGLVGIAWVGSRNNSRMSSSVFGGTVSINFWVDIMRFARNAYGGKVPKYDGSGSNVVVGVSKPPTPAIVDDVPVPPVSENDEPEPQSTDLEPKPGEEKPKPDTDTEPKREPETTKPPEQKPQTPKPTPPKDAGEETVEVELCAETLALANPFCSNTITRKMKRSNAPRRNCPVHQETER